MARVYPRRPKRWHHLKDERTGEKRVNPVHSERRLKTSGLDMCWCLLAGANSVLGPTESTAEIGAAANGETATRGDEKSAGIRQEVGPMKQSKMTS
jgi:hypothetical protein